jgi:hypothetical protein
MIRPKRKLKPQDWLRVFELARVNGADNNQRLLPNNGWKFPRDTWLQGRLTELKRKDCEKRND